MRPEASRTLLTGFFGCWQIVQGDLALGELLSERVLAEKLGVSKTPVREALFQLRTEGLVRIVPQRGAFVFTLSAAEVTAICEFRQTLEAAALQMAYRRNRAGLIAGLSAVLGDMDTAWSRRDRRAYLRADTSYHEVSFAHCGNSYLRDTYALLVGKVAALRTHLAVKPLHTEMSFAEHRRMVELLEKGQIEAALSVLNVHIARTKTTYGAEIEDIAAADRDAPRLGLEQPAKSQTAVSGAQISTSLRIGLPSKM
jgi:DNA-binding GntR family transcriptional regulator